MGKKQVILGAVSLGLGALIGIMSFLVVANPTSPARLFSLLHFGSGKLTATSQPGGDQSVPAGAAVSSAPDSLAPSQNGGTADNSAGGSSDNSAASASNSGAAADVTASASNSASTSTSTQGSDTVPSPGSGPVDTAPAASAASGTDSAAAIQVPAAEAQAITADYKQDIGIFFDAWKSQDMTAFRTELAKAYSGPLLEQHVQQANDYISHGVGMEVSKISFDQVALEQADANTATLQADYHYTASDYNLTDAVSIGNPSEHSVHVRVNLIKTSLRWVVTGETPLKD